MTTSFHELSLWHQAYWVDFLDCDLNDPKHYQVFHEQLSHLETDPKQLFDAFFKQSPSGIGLDLMKNKMRHIEEAETIKTLWSLIVSKILKPLLQANAIEISKLMHILRSYEFISIDERTQVLQDIWEYLTQPLVERNEQPKPLTKSIDSQQLSFRQGANLEEHRSLQAVNEVCNTAENSSAKRIEDFMLASAEDILPVSLKKNLWTSAAFESFRALLSTPMRFSQNTLFEKIHLAPLSELFKDLEFIEKMPEDLCVKLSQTAFLDRLINAPDFPQDIKNIKQVIKKLIPTPLTEKNLTLLFNKYLRNLYAQPLEEIGIEEVKAFIKEIDAQHYDSLNTQILTMLEKEVRKDILYLESKYYTILLVGLMATNPSDILLNQACRNFLTPKKYISNVDRSEKLFFHIQQLLDQCLDPQKITFITTMMNYRYSLSLYLNDEHFNVYLLNTNAIHAQTSNGSQPACKTTENVHAKSIEIGIDNILKFPKQSIAAGLKRLNQLYHEISQAMPKLESPHTAAHFIETIFKALSHEGTLAYSANFNHKKNGSMIALSFLLQDVIQFSSTDLTYFEFHGAAFGQPYIDMELLFLEKCTVILEKALEHETQRNETPCIPHMFLKKFLAFCWSHAASPEAIDLTPYFACIQQKAILFNFCWKQFEMHLNQSPLSIDERASRNSNSTQGQLLIHFLKFRHQLTAIHQDVCIDQAVDFIGKTMKAAKVNTKIMEETRQILTLVGSSTQNHKSKFWQQLKKVANTIQSKYVLRMPPDLNAKSHVIPPRHALIFGGLNTDSYYAEFSVKLYKYTDNRENAYRGNEFVSIHIDDDTFRRSLRQYILTRKPFLEWTVDHQDKFYDLLVREYSRYSWGPGKNGNTLLEIQECAEHRIRQVLRYNESPIKTYFMNTILTADEKSGIEAYLEPFAKDINTAMGLYQTHLTHFWLPFSLFDTPPLWLSGPSTFQLRVLIDRSLLKAFMDCLNAEGTAWKEPIDYASLAKILSNLYTPHSSGWPVMFDIIVTLCKINPEFKTLLMQNKTFKHLWILDAYKKHPNPQYTWEDIQEFVLEQPCSDISKKYARSKMDAFLNSKANSDDNAELRQQCLQTLLNAPQLLIAMNFADAKKCELYLHAHLLGNIGQAIVPPKINSPIVENKSSKPISHRKILPPLNPQWFQSNAAITIEHLEDYFCLLECLSTVPSDAMNSARITQNNVILMILHLITPPVSIPLLTACLQHMDRFLPPGMKRDVLCHLEQLLDSKKYPDTAAALLHAIVQDQNLSWIFACYAFDVTLVKSEFLDKLFAYKEKPNAFVDHVDFLHSDECCSHFIKNTYIETLKKNKSFFSQTISYDFFRPKLVESQLPPLVREKEASIQASIEAQPKPKLDLSKPRFIATVPPAMSAEVIEETSLKLPSAPQEEPILVEIIAQEWANTYAHEHETIHVQLVSHPEPSSEKETMLPEAKMIECSSFKTTIK